MDTVPVNITKPDDSAEEEVTLTANEKEEATKIAANHMTHPIDGRKWVKNHNRDTTFREALAKIANHQETLMKKKEILLHKRNARLEYINVLHEKLLCTWKDRIKVQQEYDAQYMQTLEKSQAIWQSKLFANGQSCPNIKDQDELADANLRNNKINQNEKMKKISKELMGSTQKRLKALDEIITLHNRELEETQSEYHAIERDLKETISLLKQTLDIFNMLKNNEDLYCTGPFVSYGVSENSDMGNSLNPLVDSHESVLAFRKNEVVPTDLRQSREINVLSFQTLNPAASNCPAEAEGVLEESFDSRESCTESDESFHFKFSTMSNRNNNQLPVSPILSPPVFTQRFEEIRRKRGRPRKYPNLTSKNSSVKRKRGRPRKYLKIDLSSEVPWMNL